MTKDLLFTNLSNDLKTYLYTVNIINVALSLTWLGFETLNRRVSFVSHWAHTDWSVHLNLALSRLGADVSKFTWILAHRHEARFVV